MQRVLVAGPGPDLRYAMAEAHAQFEAIVLGGARQALGMPSFADKLEPAQLRAIQAYVLSRAAASAQVIVGWPAAMSSVCWRGRDA